jgi:hypothetical protein
MEFAAQVKNFSPHDLRLHGEETELYTAEESGAETGLKVDKPLAGDA